MGTRTQLGRAVKNCTKTARVWVGASSLAACVSTAPVPELVEAAMPKPETPSTVSGTLRDDCVKRKYLFGEPAIDPEGIYSPSVTYKLAERMHRNSTMAPFASRLRVYTIGKHTKSIFGKPITRETLCLYDLQNGSLKYLDALYLSTEGGAQREIIDATVVNAYRTMSGKTSLAERLFGI